MSLDQPSTDKAPVSGAKAIAETRARGGLFYGWYLVLAAALINFAIGGICFYSITAVFNPIAATFGWGYAQISLAMTLRGVERSILNPLMGAMADRFHPKWLVMGGIFLTGLGLVVLGQTRNLFMFYLAFFILALGGSMGIDLVPTTAVVRWFKRNIGKAVGLLSVGIGFGGFVVPLVTRLVDIYEWPLALTALGIGVCVLGTPMGLLFRTKPEDYGEVPDGQVQTGADKGGAAPAPDVSVRQALRMRAFWLIGGGFMVLTAGFSAVALHIMPYLGTVGIDRSTASIAAMMMPIASIPSRYVFGWLCDRYAKSYMAMVSGALMGAGLLALSSAGPGNLAAVVLYVLLYGLGAGGVVTLSSAMLREHFGARNYGTIYGLTGIFWACGSLASPPVAGLVYDVRGDYFPIWLVFGGLSFVGMLFMLGIPRPGKVAGCR